MRKILLIPLIIAVFSLYVSQASFSYFSDTETITAELAAAIPPSSVTILYENATLTFFCHVPCCHHCGGSGASDLNGVMSKAKESPESLEHAPQCFRKVCSKAVLDGIYIKNDGRDVVLEEVIVRWWCGGKLNYLKIDNRTFESNSTSPAEVEVGVTLGGGYHSVELGFESIISPVFEITFIFDDHVEEIYFIPCVKFEWV